MPISNNSIFFEDDLKYKDTQILAQEFAPDDFASELPVDTNYPRWAETIEWKAYTGTGGWSLLASGANDFPNVGLQMEKYSRNTVQFGEMASFDTDHIEAAQANNFPLESTTIEEINRQYRQKMREILWLADGSDKYGGAYGLLYQPNILVSQSPSATSWATATTDQIVADVQYAINTIHLVSNSVNKATDVYLPLDKFMYIQTKLYSPTVSMQTVLQYLQSVNPGVRFQSRLELSAVKYGNVTTDVILAIDKSGNDIKFAMPNPIQRLPTEYRTLAYDVKYRAKTAGVIAKRPLKIHVVRGI